MIGKRNKERVVSVSLDAVAWLEAWLQVRRWDAGPLFCPTPRGGRVVLRRLCGQTIRDVLAERSKLAAVRDATPHDFRRTVIGDLLDLGVDVVLVSQLVGHADPKQTGGYDRRPQRAQRDAVDRLHLPQTRRARARTVGARGGARRLAYGILCRSQDSVRTS